MQSLSLEKEVVVEKKSTALISPVADHLMAGGLSLIVFVVCMLVFERGLSSGFGAPAQAPMGIFFQVSWAMYFLSFFVNYPHFLASYQLLYGDYRARIRTDKKFFFAAVVFPIFLIAGMAYALTQKQEWLPFFVHAMYLAVGWHYVKQVYGIVLFTSAREKIFYSEAEKRTLRWLLISLAALSWAYCSAQPGDFHFYGIGYQSLRTSADLLTIFSALVYLLAGVVVAQGIRRYIKTGQIPSSLAVTALITLFVWYLPFFHHSLYVYTIPFAHSLQYLWFVITLKRNKTEDLTSSLQGEELRKAWLIQFCGFFALAVVLGALFFVNIPTFLDRHFAANFAAGPTIFLALFSLFINLHHYAIDAVLWKRDNADLGKYLGKPK